jgi:subtilisin family serine protease
MNADPVMAPHVINNSWYCSTDEGCNPANFILMEEVVNNLKAAGIVVVVSAGNSGWEGCGSVTGPPAFFEGSFSVGATDSNDNIAGFSSRGPVVIDSSLRLKPNVSAPGVGVRSVVKGGGFAFFNGTSMAGPHVAGLVGLILSANPALAGKVELIEDIIEQTAVPRTDTTMCGNVPGTSIPNPFYGYGRVNAVTAVTRALEIASQTQDTDDSGLYVYPNPVSDLVTITAPDKEEISKVEIFSAAGTLAKRQDGSGLRSLFIMDLSGLPAGLYYYRVQFKNRSQAGKLVKH